MKILHCILTREFAGSERYACELARLQAEAGHEAYVVIRDAGKAYVDRFLQECGQARVVLIPKWLPSLFDRFAFRGVMKALRPELVHTHLGRAAKRAGKAAKAMGLPLVATLHLDWRDDYKVCDGVICIAEWQRKSIPQGYTGKVAVVWNWVPGAGVEPESRPRGHKEVVFGSVGRLVGKKGMDVLIKAFRQAFPMGDEPVALEIAGQGPDHDMLADLALGDKRIRLLGYRDDVDSLYGGWDVYVSAAKYEPFGLTILEAMRAGCRVVCTRTAGPSEFLADFPGVTWAEVDDEATMGAALGLAAGQASKSSERVAWDMRAFSPEAALGKVMRFYEEVRGK